MAELIGLQVTVPGPAKATGILRYVGPIQGKPGQFGGIELQGPSAAARGKNNGDVAGIQYFRVAQPMTGLFLSWDRLRSANSSLFDRPRSRTSSRRDVHTPTMSRISSISSVSRSSSRNTSGSSVKTAHGYSRSGEFEPVSKMNERSISVLHHPVDHGEADELRKQLMQKSREVVEKQSVLDELHRTVAELQPLLDDYERSLEAKDKKIAKQKQEFDRAREEWRQCLDLMSSSQQEAEGLYEMQISDLKEEIHKLRGQASPTDSVSFQLELKALREENESLKMSLAQHAEMPDFGKLTDDYNSVKSRLRDVEAQSKDKDVRIFKLENELEAASNKDLAELSNKVTAMSVSDSAESERQIAALETQLADMRKRYEQQESSSSQKIAAQERQIAALTGQVDKLTSQAASSKQAGSGASVDTEESEVLARAKDLVNTVEDLKHELGMRPSFEELTELQDSLEEVEKLHESELQSKDREITDLTNERTRVAQEMQKLRDEIEKMKRTSVEPGRQDPAPSNGSLPIYSPGASHDPSSGRSDWCGLCERDGHDSLNCPYENDIF